MAARGITVLLASGDNGVGCDAKGTSQEFDFPSSPYITMVGATYLDAGSSSRSGSPVEVGATLSSGGFSKDYYRPSWQDDAVAAYFASATYKAHTPSETFFADGRAYPDVAAFGQNVQVVAAGKVEGVSGTSCSAPIFGGLIALLNHELMSAGKPPMGWINPWIYANPQMFTDVTEGSNPYEKCDGLAFSLSCRSSFCSSLPLSFFLSFFLSFAFHYLFLILLLRFACYSGMGSCHWLWNSHLSENVGSSNVCLSGGNSMKDLHNDVLVIDSLDNNLIKYYYCLVT